MTFSCVGYLFKTFANAADTCIKRKVFLSFFPEHVLKQRFVWKRTVPYNPLSIEVSDKNIPCEIRFP